MFHEDFEFGTRVRIKEHHVLGGNEITGEVCGITTARNALPFQSYIILLDNPYILPEE